MSRHSERNEDLSFSSIYTGKIGPALGNMRSGVFFVILSAASTKKKRH